MSEKQTDVSINTEGETIRIGEPAPPTEPPQEPQPTPPEPAPQQQPETD